MRTDTHSRLHCSCTRTGTPGGIHSSRQRAWLIRDGIEDYELLALAERKLGREKVIELVKPFIKDPFTWTNDPAVLNQVRAKLAAAVEKD